MSSIPVKSLSSAANPTLKAARALTRKNRRRDAGAFLAEGARTVIEAIDHDYWPRALFLTEEALSRPQLQDLARSAQRKGAEILAVSPRLLAQLTERENPQTVLGVFDQFSRNLADITPDPSDFFVALERVRDPGNLGTILRTADAIGARATLLIGECCDPFGLEVVRASMGSFFAQPFYTASLEEFGHWRARHRLQTLGAALQGAQALREIPITFPAVLMLGNEQAGLSAPARALCDQIVKLPMRGRADSLNLASAAAVFGYHVWERQGFAGERP